MNSNLKLLWQISRIKVWPLSTEVSVDNPTQFEMVGRGRQGAVFRTDPSRCVKVFADELTADVEFLALKAGEESGVCPKVYDWGPNWILMEYFDAPTVSESLQEAPLGEDLSRRLLELLETCEAIGYSRLDHPPRDIFILPDGTLRIVDANHLLDPWVIETRLPRRLLEGLGDQAEAFVRHARRFRFRKYLRWIRHPDYAATMARAAQGSGPQDEA